MKKSLFALAVFGAFSGAAFAGGSHVQLYGVIDVGVTHFTGLSPGAGAPAGATVSSTGLSSGGEFASRVGVKGREDLGGGLSAIFDAETGICGVGQNQDKSTTNTSGVGNSGGFCTGGGFMGRQSWVGLHGSFGTVMGGRQYTGFYEAEGHTDPFHWGLNGRMGNLSLVAFLNASLVHASQLVTYVTPNLSGFTGTASYSFAPSSAGTVPTAQPAGSNVERALNFNGTYTRGPVTAGAGYWETTNMTTLKNPTTGVNDGNMKAWELYGDYDFGPAKVSAMYERMTATYYSGNDESWMIGVTIPAGHGRVLASFNENKNTLTADPGETDTFRGVGTAKQVGIGYIYSLSKSTNLYASYAHLTNGTHTNFAVQTSGDQLTGVDGQSASGIAVGLHHAF